ncbi:MAG: KH domain-containing protein [Bacilli bacterium]|nr:KH domain-containing protein [Bacilli bacterium]
MGGVNYEKLVSELIKPLTTHPEEVVVTTSNQEGNVVSLKVSVHPDDLGRIIGKKGRVANAIRTLAYAAAAREKVRLEIDLGSEE